MLIIRAGGGRRGGAQAAERDVECRCQSRDQATKLCRVDLSVQWICLGIGVSYCHHGVEHKHDTRLPVTPPLKWPHNQTICSVPTLSRLSHNVTPITWKEETEWLSIGDMCTTTTI